MEGKQSSKKQLGKNFYDYYIPNSFSNFVGKENL